MSLYFQDRSAGPNATVVPLTGLSGHLWALQSFGSVFVTDDLINEAVDKDSAEIASNQGIYVTFALDGSTTHVLISITFIGSSVYNGSKLAIQGASRQFEKVREVVVVGGTGKFRLASGFARFEMVYFDTSISYAVIQCNGTVRHY